MTGQEILSLVRDDIQDASAGRFTDAQLLGIVNEGYQDFCRVTEIAEKTQTEVIPALTSLGSLPSDFLDIRQFRWSYNREIYPRTERQLDYQEQGWPFQVGTPEACIWYNWNTIRLKPITTSAGTITYRYAYVPSTALTLTTEPAFVHSFHMALVDFADSQCFWMMREYDNAKRYWDSYLKTREKAKAQARVGQRTPDTFTSQRPVTIWNYNRWDYGYRNR